MAHPCVSVICAFHNGEAFLGEAIESVLAQDFRDFELLLVDDGSTDGSTARARSCAAAFPGRVRYLRHRGHANRGVAASRNLGLRSAGGEFVAFIDCDDVWRTRKLSEQVAIMTRDPWIGMLCGIVNYWSAWVGGKDRLVPTGGRRDKLLIPPRTILALYPLGGTHAPCPSDVMVRRSLVELGCLFEERFTGALQIYEDQTFFAKVYLAAPVYFSRRVWLDYRQHDESCVSVVVRDGRYAEARREFLGWLKTYVRGRNITDKDKILEAVERARWELDHPAIARPLRRVRRFTAALRT